MMGMVMVMAIEKGTFRAKGVDNTAEISTWHLERFAPGLRFGMRRMIEYIALTMKSLTRESMKVFST